MMGSGMNLITTAIGFGMSATFIVFVCTRIICGRLRAAESGPNYEIESRINIEQPESRASGLEAAMVAAIPTMMFDREAFSSIEDAQCSICLGEYLEKEVLRIMPKCGHNFHLSCIDVWLQKQSTCPVCRLPLQTFATKLVVTPLTTDQEAFHDAQISTAHSQLWLLPGPNRSERNGSTEARVESASANPSVPREMETMQ